MHFHRKITAILAAGMLVFLAVVLFALNALMASFTAVMHEVDAVSGETQRLQAVERDMEDMAANVERFLTTGDNTFRDAYQSARAAARTKAEDLRLHDNEMRDRTMLIALRLDLRALEQRADRIVQDSAAAPRSRKQAAALMNEISVLIARRQADIENHFKEERSRLSGRLTDHFYVLKNRVAVLFLLTLLATLGLLAGFGLYLRRRIALPLDELGKGAAEVSRGNLDYRIALRGETDLSRLADQFNTMAGRLRQSYGELEQKLNERTKELTAIDAVALTLSQSGSP